MPEYNLGPCDCCDAGGEITQCGCTIPQTLTLTVDAVSGISCPGNITVGTWCTLTWDGISAWNGFFLADDSEQVNFSLGCVGGEWKLTGQCAGGGSAGIKTVEAGFSCEPVDFTFLALALAGACCGGTSGSIDVSVTE